MDVEISKSPSDIEGESDAVDACDATVVSTPVTPASPADKLRRKRRVLRQNSKEGAGAPGVIPQIRNWKNSRRPRNGHGRGLPKKGGAGGKGVWGKVGSELFEEMMEDPQDPNYDSEAPNGDVEFKQVIVEADPEEVVHKSESVILEYFQHGDTNEAAENFLEFVTPKRSHLVCETIIEVALDHKPSHCEMASVLISDLYGRLFTAEDIGLAFQSIIRRLPDLQLDIPDAVTLISNFLARCVADDCLPPRFVSDLADNKDNLEPLAQQVIHRAESMLSMKHGMVRLDNVWGVGGGLRPVKSLIRQIQLLLKEYLTSGDLNEAIRCVRELEVPHFHHELVYETVILALEAVNTSVEQQLCAFLGELYKTVIVTADQMDNGFLRVLEDMGDIVLDVPLAYIMLDRFVERCSSKFKLGERVHSNMPTRGRKRYVSEGDGGHIKEHALKLRE